MKPIRRKVVGWNPAYGFYKLECGHEMPVASQNNTPDPKTRRCLTCERIRRAARTK